MRQSWAFLNHHGKIIHNKMCYLLYISIKARSYHKQSFVLYRHRNLFYSVAHTVAVTGFISQIAGAEPVDQSFTPRRLSQLLQLNKLWDCPAGSLNSHETFLIFCSILACVWLLFLLKRSRTAEFCCVSVHNCVHMCVAFTGRPSSRHSQDTRDSL